MHLKGLLHLHSSYSYDGSVGLKALRDTLLQRGYSFALMTEHSENLSQEHALEFIAACKAESTDQFTVIPGFEVPHGTAHVLALGTHSYPALPTDPLLEHWHAEGAILVLAHPYRDGYTFDRFLRERMDGVEIWNSQYDGIHAPRRSAVQWYRRISCQLLALKAYAGLDLHRLSHVNGPYLMVEAEQYGENDILSSLRDGSFSISNGTIVLNSRGRLQTGNPWVVAVVGSVVPILVSISKTVSSILARIGLRSFPLKRWIRKHL